MNNQSANVRVYKTPLKKLAGFFQDSRDKWKQRSAEKVLMLRRPKSET
jgi:hypothetical protein